MGYHRLMSHTVTLDRPAILRIAADADVDPRSVERELAAERGERPHVRGRAGQKIRDALARLRSTQSEAA